MHGHDCDYISLFHVHASCIYSVISWFCVRAFVCIHVCTCMNVIIVLYLYIVNNLAILKVSVGDIPVLCNYIALVNVSKVNEWSWYSYNSVSIIIIMKLDVLITCACVCTLLYDYLSLPDALCWYTKLI